MSYCDSQHRGFKLKFKIESSVSDAWMPTHYRKLQAACLAGATNSSITPMDFGFSIAASPKPHVQMLSSAASKYRLAKYCDGLIGTDDPSVLISTET